MTSTSSSGSGLRPAKRTRLRTARMAKRMRHNTSGPPAPKPRMLPQALPRTALHASIPGAGCAYPAGQSVHSSAPLWLAKEPGGHAAHSVDSRPPTAASARDNEHTRESSSRDRSRESHGWRSRGDRRCSWWRPRSRRRSPAHRPEPARVNTTRTATRASCGRSSSPCTPCRCPRSGPGRTACTSIARRRLPAASPRRKADSRRVRTRRRPQSPVGTQ